MRAALGVLSVLVALAALAVLAKKQFSSPSATSASTPTTQQQSIEVQQKYKKALEGALQQPRAILEVQKDD